jgi:hypothetical protein
MTMPAAVYSLFLICERQAYKDGRYRFTELDGTSWTLGIMMGAFISAFEGPVAWLFLGWERIAKREQRKARKLEIIRRRNDDAFFKLKEARRCLLQQKKDENNQAVTAWTREWNAALKPEHDRRIAASKERDRLALEARRTARGEDKELFDFFRSEGYSMSEAQRHSLMYADLYGDDDVCRHGNSRRYHCYSCSPS